MLKIEGLGCKRKETNPKGQQLFPKVFQLIVKKIEPFTLNGTANFKTESGDVRALRIVILYSKGFFTWKERSFFIKLFSH